MEDPSNQETDLSTVNASGSSSAGSSKKYLKPLRIIILILAVVCAVLFSLSFCSRPFDKTNNRFTNITIEKTDKLSDAATKLEEAGIVYNARRFAFISRLMFLTDFKPGTYYLSPSMDTVEIARTMVKGLTTSNGFTIPAGYTIYQIADSLSRDGFVDKDKFLKAASSDFFQDIEIIGHSIKGEKQLEGFLLPDEYVINSNADESMILITMIDRFSNFFNDDYKARAEELDMSIREIVVIASMIESETSIEKEKALISGIIHNRINLELISDADLPDVPLCCPSRESITAALYPEDTEYTYYVLSDKLDGSHVYTDSEEEYEELVKAYNQAKEDRNQNMESGEEESDGE